MVRTEWAEAILELEPIDQATIFQNLFYYHIGKGDISTPNLQTKLVWKLIEPNLKRNIENYDKRCETSANNGKKGGRPKKPNKPNKKPIENPILPTETLNDSDSDSVSVSVSEPEIVIEEKRTNSITITCTRISSMTPEEKKKAGIK